MAEKDLKHMLHHTLRSPALLKQAKLLRADRQLEMIYGHLWEINAVFLDARLRALKDPKVEGLANDITAAIADVQYLLDRILDWQPELPTAAAVAAAAAASAAGAAFNCSPQPLPCFPEIPDACLPALLLEMKETASRLNLLASRGASMDLRKEMMESMDPREKEFGDILQNEAVQRKDVKKVIESLQNRRHNEEIPFMLALRGPDGSGKTTLARMIFHDPWVRQHFDTHIWVDSPNCFSFDPIGIARDFAESVTKEPCSGHYHLQTLWLRINKELIGKRYLLIIDDVAIRKEDHNRWEQLKHVFLRVGMPGSRVIATSSSGAELPSFDRDSSIRSLDEDEWAQLFSINAMIPGPGRQISTRLGKGDRSPLLAKLLGLWFRYTEQSPSQEESYVVSHDDRYLPLLLQFLLPTNEQLRIYHSLFPGYYSHDLENLLQMLTAEGIVPSPGQKTTAAYHLRRFLSEYQKEELTSQKKQRQIRILVDNVLSSNYRPRQWPHVTLSVDQSTREFPKDQASSKLRSLILVRDENMILANQKCQIKEIPESMFENLGDLRVLDLQATMIRELPAAVCKMLNLRYLNLSWSDLETLPKCLCRLRNLQTLKLDHCENLHRLPEEIHNLWKLQVLKLAYCTKLKKLPESVAGILHLQELDIEGCDGLVELPEDLKNLKNLRYLNMMRCAKLTRMPRGIQHLTKLQTLLGYVAVDAGGSCTIPKLQHLDNLEELHLENLDRVKNPRDAQSMNLQDKRYLRRVQFIWDTDQVVDTKTAQEEDVRKPEKQELALRKAEQVLEKLEVNTALRKLEIVSYQGKELPKWMKQGQPYHYCLTEIKLVNLKRCEALPPLSLLPRLRIVEISGMDCITVVGQEFYETGGIFPSLEKLTFSEMPNLQKWESKIRDETKKKRDLFPRLAELTLVQCPRFEEIEVTLPAIRRLYLWLNINEKLLRSETVDKLKSATSLEVVGWKSLPSQLDCFAENISSLRIDRCEELVSLPEWLKLFGELRSLNISSCYKLSSIPEGLLEALPHLKDKEKIFEDCPKLERHAPNYYIYGGAKSKRPEIGELDA